MPRVPYEIETKVDGVCVYLDGGKSIPDLKYKYPGIQHDLNDLKVLEGVAIKKEITVDEIRKMIEKTKAYNKERAKEKQRGVFHSIFPYQQ